MPRGDRLAARAWPRPQRGVSWDGAERRRSIRVELLGPLPEDADRPVAFDQQRRVDVDLVLPDRDVLLELARDLALERLADRAGDVLVDHLAHGEAEPQLDVVLVDGGRR